MTVRNQNFKIYRGNSATLSVAVTQADGSPYDPTLNAIIRWRLAKTSSSDEVDALARKSLVSGITLAPGGVNIVLDPVDTDYPPGVYYHELKIEDAGDVATSMTGFVIIKPSVSMGDNVTPTKLDIKLSGTAPARAP